jgi:hypothetical protein
MRSEADYRPSEMESANHKRARNILLATLVVLVAMQNSTRGHAFRLAVVVAQGIEYMALNPLNHWARGRTARTVQFLVCALASVYWASEGSTVYVAGGAVVLLGALLVWVRSLPAARADVQ